MMNIDNDIYHYLYIAEHFNLTKTMLVKCMT